VAVSVIAPDFVVSEIHKRAIGPDGEPLGDSPMREAKIMTPPPARGGSCRRSKSANDWS